EFFPLPLPDGPGKALRLSVQPVRDHIPVYLAAIGPKNLELAGEVADGWLAIFFSPAYASELTASLNVGRERVGRTDSTFDGSGRLTRWTCYRRSSWASSRASPSSYRSPAPVT